MKCLCSTIVLFLLIVLFIDFLPISFGGYAAQRFLLLSISGSVVLVVGFGWLNPAREASQSQVLWQALPGIFLAVLFFLLSFPYRFRPFNWIEPGMYAFYFLFIILVGGRLAQLNRAERLVGAFIFLVAGACFFYGAMTINVYLFAISGSVANLVNYIPWGFVNIRYWSHVATWLLPLLPLAVFIGPYKDNRLWKTGVALAAALWWWIVLMSSARGTMLGVGFGTLLVLLLIGRPSFPWLKVSAKYLLFGVCAWLLLSVLIPSILLDEVQIRSIKTGGSGRWPLFLEAFQMSIQNFPFGMGPQSWLTHEIITEAYRNSPKFGHPHNMYLMWAAEYGWLLIAGLLVLVGQAAKNFWVKRTLIRSGQAPELALILAAFTASVSAALFHAGVSAVFMAPGSMLIGLLVLTLFWALVQPPVALVPPLTVRQRRGRTKIALLVTAVVAVLCVVWLREVWHYYRAMEQDVEFYHEHASEGTLPRFWFHGNYPRHPSQMP